MKRPTRVPASMVVRMNSASNRMAKWYQNAISALPPIRLEKMCAMPTARVGAPPARDRMLVSPTSFAVSRQHVGRDGEAPAGDDLRRLLGVGADQPGRAVHREVDAGLEHAGGDQRHDRHERLHQHAAVADEAGLGFVLQHLRRGARGDQGMEAGDGATGDGDEQEREQAAGAYRPGAVDELGQRRHLQVGLDDDDADRQCQDGADLEEGGEVVARRQQQPHRQH